MSFTYLKTTHSYHLVDPSPWPIVAAFGAFMFTTGTVLYMHKYIGGWNLLLTGFLIILYVMYTWWRDVIREATFCAGRTHCKVSHPRHIDWHYFFSPLLGSLLRICLVMLRYKKYHQFCFKQTMGVGVKRLGTVVKISVNHSQALIGVVSRLDWAFSFLSRSSLIFKRLRFYSLASNCVKPVQTIHLAMSTYTFNYYVRGEIRKKTWLNKSTCYNNKLAPKFRNFYSSIPQTSALVLVKQMKMSTLV
jgi:hypothetical protein